MPYFTPPFFLTEYQQTALRKKRKYVSLAGETLLETLLAFFLFVCILSSLGTTFVRTLSLLEKNELGLEALHIAHSFWLLQQAERTFLISPAKEPHYYLVNKAGEVLQKFSSEEELQERPILNSTQKLNSARAVITISPWKNTDNQWHYSLRVSLPVKKAPSKRVELELIQ